ncbi:substrate-binding domain-containing protein [Streptomyces sp. NPDC005921]
MARLPGRNPELDAVLVGSDLKACGALHVLGEVGLGVPEDVAVIDFDHLGSFAKARTAVLPLAGPRRRVTLFTML